MLRRLPFLEIAPKSWEDAKTLRGPLAGFVFRGHADATWPLMTSMERALEQQRRDLTDQAGYEHLILDKFKSRAHHFIPSAPHNNEIMEWLALIQDYGGPTRLLDFTESFYIASFFAAEMATSDACVWAINRNALYQKEAEKGAKFEKAVRARKTYFNSIKLAEFLMEDVLYPDLPDLVLAIQPPRLNERLAIQKGLFLLPCNITKSFERNLCSTFDLPFDTLNSGNSFVIPPGHTRDISMYYTEDCLPAVVKIKIMKEWNLNAIRDLYSMNIDSASLFPGLDGFARSLRFIVRDTEII